MTEKTSLPHGAQPIPAQDAKSAGLSGSMGPFRLFTMVLAFVAPLVAVAGWVSILIVFGGKGAPLLMLSAMVLVFIFAVGFVAMGHHMSSPGAFYSYVSASLGRSMGLGVGFIAMVTYAFLGLSNFVFFGIVASDFVVARGGPELNPYWYALGLLALTTIFGILNIDVSVKLLMIVLLIEVAIVLIFNFAVVGGNTSPAGAPTLEPFSWSAIATGGSWGIGILFAILLFNGFEGTAAYREEVRNPARTIGRATFAVVAFVGVFYAFASWALLSYFGIDEAVELATNDPARLFSAAAEGAVGSWLVDAANIMVMTSSLATAISIHGILSRYLYSMSVDGVISRKLAVVHPRRKSPYRAAFLASLGFLVIGLAFVLATRIDATLLYGQFGGTGGFAYLLLFAIVSAAIFVYFWRRRGTHTISVWKSAVAPAVAFVAMGTLAVVAFLNFTDLTGGSEAMAVVFQVFVWGAGAIGVVLALVYRAKRPDIYARIGRRDVNKAPSEETAAILTAEQS